MNILVTGAAGFIGFHLSRQLCALGHTVIGLDNLNDYYAPQLKRDRLAVLAESPQFTFLQLDLADAAALAGAFQQTKISHVIHLAAQAGVRYSLTNPQAYVQSNLVGFANLLEECRQHQVQHLVYASSSSVYGLNAQMPYATRHNVDHPMSLYAASKKSNELMAHCYSHLFRIPTSGLRFFTVYGPWGRPDMAMHIFSQAIRNGTPLPLFNQGQLSRDFTYIDDIVDGVIRVLSHPAEPDPQWLDKQQPPDSSSAPYALYNIGNNQPVAVLELIRLLEDKLGRSANIQYLPMQPGDVQATYADIEPLERAFDFAPSTSLSAGLDRFLEWHLSYYS